jgi:ABC-type phosphate transport system substrate-binding protein
MLARLLVAALLTLALPITGATAEPRPLSAGGAGYVIIVNSANPSSNAERRFLADAFLKKVTRWPNGEVIKPVDLGASSSVRRAFSDEVVGRNVEAVKSYWQQVIFSGHDVPPPELDSDDDVVRYVLKHPGAVGYVSPNANLAGAKILSVR